MSAKDSGKPLVDAAFGEVIVTCEKLWWLAAEGERHLRPEARSAGYMVSVYARVCWEGGLQPLPPLGRRLGTMVNLQQELC